MVQIKGPERLKQLQAIYFSCFILTIMIPTKTRQNESFSSYFTLNRKLNLVEQELSNIYKSVLKDNKYVRFLQMIINFHQKYLLIIKEFSMFAY